MQNTHTPPRLSAQRRRLALALTLTLFTITFGYFGDTGDSAQAAGTRLDYWLGRNAPVNLATTLTVTPITWNIVGLDSNNPASGPHLFPVGARVCSSVATTNVAVNFVWDSANANINLRAGSLSSISIPAISAGGCADAYFEVDVTQTAAAFDTTRRYHIAATDSSGTASTPTPREVYVEHLISQNRNSISDIKFGAVGGPYASVPAGGSMNLVVGDTYDIQLFGGTATQGYNQFEEFINFPNTIFQIIGVNTSYSADDSPYVPNPNNKLYADACLWQNDPNSPVYRACTGGDFKAGGQNVVTTYTVKIISGGGTSQALGSLLYDFSGSSYHYNGDFGFGARTANITDPTSATISKSFSPGTTSVNGISALTIALTNPNASALGGYNFVDNLPANLVVANPNGATTSGCGTPTLTANAGSNTISFSNGTLAGNSTCVIKVNVTPTATGALVNTTNNLFIDTADTGHNATATLTVNNAPPPGAGLCGVTLANWSVPNGTTANPPDLSGGLPTVKAANVATATLAANVPGSASINTSSGHTDTTSWNTFGYKNAGQFIQFTLDTTNYTGVQMSFWVANPSPANGPTQITVTVNNGGGFGAPVQTINSPAAAFTQHTVDLTGLTNTSGNTLIRLTATGANNDSNGASLLYDDMSFTGCGVPVQPTISKAFAPNPIAANGVSTLTFTLTNTNTAPLTGAAFTDTLPSGVQVAATPAAATTCGGTWTPTSGNTTLTFSGGTIPASGSCTVSVNVTATTAGPHGNVSGFLSTAEGGTNTNSIASASLTAVMPPSISKLFSSPIIPAGVSTLTFTITNPNQNDALSGVTFGDTFPTSPGAMVVAATPNPTTTGCGSPTFTPAPGSGSISFSGGTIAAGGTCVVSVNVTAPTVGTYNNTSGNVSHIINAQTINGNTALASLVVNPPNPAIRVLKQVGPSNSGPWSPFLPVTIGNNVFYRFTVENTGDVPLLSPQLTDNTVNISTCNASWSGLTLPVAVQANNNHIITCVVGPITAASGTHTNTAHVSATYNSNPVTSPNSSATYASTGLTLAKSVTESSYTSPGDTLHYSYLVTNSGFAPLAGPVSVSDNKTTVTCPAVSTVGDLDNFLDPGESVTCTATYTVTASDVTAGSVTNQASATADGVTSNTDSKTVLLAVSTSPPSITKAFSPNPIAVGGVSTLTFTITNPNVGTALTGVAFTDSFPAGLQVAATPNATVTGCGSPTFSPSSGNTLLSFSGGTIAASGTCTVAVNVTATTAGTKANTTGNVTSTNGGTGNTGSDTLTVLSAPSIAKAFSPNPVSVGGVSTLTFTITNPNAGTALTGISFTDSFPAGLQVAATPNASTTGCGAPTFAPAAGNTSLSFSGGTIAASGTCTVSVAVTATTSGAKVNTTGNVASTNGGTGNTGTDTLTVLSAPAITKAFSPNPIAVGGVSTLTFTIMNPSAGTALTGVAFTDSFPAGLQVAATPSASTTGCGSPTFAPAAGNTSLSFSGGTIAASGTCTVTVNVTATTAGAKVNTTGNVTSTNGGTGNTGNSTLAVLSPPSIAKAFSPNPVAVGGVSTLTFTVTNPNAGSALNGVAFMDSFPAGLQVAATPNVTTTGCGSPTFAPAAGNTSLNFSGGTVAASGTCTVTVNVTATTSGAKVNTTGSVTSTNGGTGNTGTDTLAVLAPPSIAKAFSPNPIAVGGVSTLTFTITNSNAGTSLTGVAFTDSFPAGLQVAATPNVTTSGCGSPTFAPAAGNTLLSFSGGTIAASGTCTVTVNITATTSGSKPNTTGNVTSTNGGTGNTGTATLTVLSPPSMAKAFSPNPIAIGGVSTLTFTITNSNTGTSLTGIAFTDSFPGGLQVAASPNASTTGCGSPTFAPAAGNTSLSFSGGTIAANAICTVSVAVTATSAGNKPNTSGSVNSTNGGTGNTASDTLTVVAPPSIAKAFSPTSIPQGSTSTLTFMLTNPAANTVAENGVAFTDNFPAGMTVASPVMTTNTCGGSLTNASNGALTAGDTSIKLLGGTVGTASPRTCTISVVVTATVGSKTNTSGNVSSTNGGTGNTASDTLTVVAPPSITKSFNPVIVPVNSITTLTLAITNPAANTVALTGVSVTDNFLPDAPGMQVDTTPGATNSFGTGTFVTIAGATSISLSGATIPVNTTYTFSVRVKVTASGPQTNTTGNVTSSNGGTGNTASASLNTTVPPTVTKAFGASDILLNGTTSLTLSLSNANATTLTGVAVTDNLPAGLIVATPNGLTSTCGGTVNAVAGSSLVSLTGGTIAANSSCTLKVDVKGTTAGTKNNQTGTVSTNETSAGSPSNVATLTVRPFTVSLTDPPVCLGPGGLIGVTATATNSAAFSQSVDFTSTMPTGLVPVNGTCVTTAGTCTVNTNTNPQTVRVMIASLGAGQTATITYQAQLGDVPTGTQLCIGSQAVFGGGTPVSVQTCTTVTCPPVGPGLPFPAPAEVSDQKAGSVLVYNLYSSSSAAPNSQNTRISITNTHPSLPIAVHLFFVDGTTCSIADSLVCLTPKQTASFLASDIDPGTTGYLIAVASDRRTGCPINFNYLIGDAYVKLSSGHAANLAAESFAAIPGGLPACDALSVTTVLNFDSVSYNRAPRVLAASNIPSRANGNDTLIVLNRLGGSLVASAATLTNLFGILYDDAETPLSFTFSPGTCQFRSSLSNNFPRTAPRLEQFIPTGRSGWAKFYSLSDIGLLGAQLNYNASAGAAANAFNQGHNLHKLTLTTAASLTIPIFPPNC